MPLTSSSRSSTSTAAIAVTACTAATSAPAAVIAYRRGDAAVLVNARSRPVRFAVAGFGMLAKEFLQSEKLVVGK